MNEIKVFEDYAESEKSAFFSLRREIRWTYKGNQGKWMIRSKKLWDNLSAREVEIPDSLLLRYPIDMEIFHESRMQLKYQFRGYNTWGCPR
jgi:hypothetical protein